MADAKRADDNQEDGYKIRLVCVNLRSKLSDWIEMGRENAV